MNRSRRMPTFLLLGMFILCLEDGYGNEDFQGIKMKNRAYMEI
ncbi:hypothetical protein M565_ctg3P002 [Vibrio cyclitrophicus FF75]|nr:hypothetical protein M565_ctg3P002 [Vibrio cyclitrophicus FF75]